MTPSIRTKPADAPEEHAVDAARGRNDARPPEPWSLPGERIASDLGVDPSVGLSSAEVRRRLAAHGPNRLRAQERRSLLAIAAAQFRSVIVVLLAVAAVLSLVFGSLVEAAAIAAVLVVNALIGFLTELRAVQSMESLRELADVPANVRREGELRRISARELVPGDVVVVEGGDVVTADLRLVEASRLQADESALTGESVPVEKEPEAVEEAAPLAERSSMLYKGTAVTRGTGIGLVVATGMETELGHVSALVEEADEEERTPLERRLAGLGRRLVWVTLGLASIVLGSGLVRGRDPLLVVETAIALAVAAIPEGLPIVATLALARGMWRMANRNALVERLSAVETLGSTTVILTDKTGTLTENRMHVRRIRLGGREVELEGTGTETTFREADEPLDASADAGLRALLRAGALCNDATLPSPDSEDEGPPPGDPMETALLEAAAAAGLPREELLERWPEVDRDAFDPESRTMTTVHEADGAFLSAVKGAPESVITAATHVRHADDVRTMESEEREAWLGRVDEMAREGLRLLAVAESEGDERPGDLPPDRLVLLGLVGFLDPPRADVRASVEACRSAGVRVVMVTGDHPATALNVAEAVGIAGPEEEAVAGSDLGASEDPDPALRRRLLGASVFARTEPAQKLQLLDLHQDEGSVAAMIGDGVNDAPALKKADIGVAMGLRGTQVAREAADMVLQDDRFGTVVTAVEFGRAIFANIRKFVVYLLSCNAAEILVVTLASLAGAPLPILPLQILFLNLVTDVFPALALGAVEGAPDLMRRPPRDPREEVLTRRHWTAIGAYGVVITATVLSGFAYALAVLERGPYEAVTLSFLILAFSQLWHVFNMAEPESRPLRNEVTRSALVWGAVVLCVGLLLGVVYVPVAAETLELVPPDRAGWSLVLGLSLVPLAAGRLVTALRRPALERV